MISKVATLLLDPCSMFEFGVVCEVFGVDRTAHGAPAVRLPSLRAVPANPCVRHARDSAVRRLRTRFPARRGSRRGATAGGAVRLPGGGARRGAGRRRCRRHRPQSVSGVFLLGEAGLLDGRKCTTHWEYVEELATRFPTATVDPDVLFVDEGNLVTSAGTAAGIDACLHVVRRELGSTVANTIARRMVVPPQRDGGQRQFIEQPVVACTSDSLSETMAWMSENLELPHTIDELAARSSMSTRTFARKFAAETGTTPVKWLTTQRVLYARQLLEGTDLGLEAISRRSGFGSGALLRHHFNRVVGVAPADYRRRFGCNTAELTQ